MATPVQGSRQSPEEVPFGSVLAVSVRARRERAGLSQGELAKLAGLSAGTLSVVEAGTGNPTVSTLLALSKVLGCDVTDLLRDATDPMIRLLRHSDPAPPGEVSASPGCCTSSHRTARSSFMKQNCPPGRGMPAAPMRQASTSTSGSREARSRQGRKGRSNASNPETTSASRAGCPTATRPPRRSDVPVGTQLHPVFVGDP
ncbi:helix-turn-helix domain-containing protein [Actinomadura luteofluorescens]|uniref:helix-turn-helix domain-containing protein n=1 Tax=Actinomadura luteofluorescens TaxID=46163 RepID=UPI003634DF3A